MARFRNRYKDEDQGDYDDAYKNWRKEGRFEDEAREEREARRALGGFLRGSIPVLLARDWGELANGPAPRSSHG